MSSYCGRKICCIVFRNGVRKTLRVDGRAPPPPDFNVEENRPGGVCARKEKIVASTKRRSRGSPTLKSGGGGARRPPIRLDATYEGPPRVLAQLMQRFFHLPTQPPAFRRSCRPFLHAFWPIPFSALPPPLSVAIPTTPFAALPLLPPTAGLTADTSSHSFQDASLLREGDAPSQGT